MSQVQAIQRRIFAHIDLLQIAIILLAVVTALIHLDRALMMGPLGAHIGNRPGGFSGGPPGGGGRFGGPGRAGGAPGGGGLSLGSSIMRALPVSLTTLFYLNFAGYIVLAIALYLPLLRQYQRIVRWVLIAFTALTIIAWFLFTGGSPNLLAYIDKPVEVALIILLLIDDRRSSLRKRREEATLAT